jgi:hypothetical protein
MFSIGEGWISCLQIKGNENDFMKWFLLNGLTYHDPWLSKQEYLDYETREHNIFKKNCIYSLFLLEILVALCMPMWISHVEDTM